MLLQEKLEIISSSILLLTIIVMAWGNILQRNTQKELVKERVLRSAFDISFTMTRPYLSNLDPVGLVSQTTFGNSKVGKFNFINLNNKKIGRSVIFNENSESNYYLDTEEKKIFLEIIKMNKGNISANVTTTDGHTFIYTFEATTNHWENFDPNINPNLSDNFILVKKDIL